PVLRTTGIACFNTVCTLRRFASRTSATLLFSMSRMSPSACNPWHTTRVSIGPSCSAASRITLITNSSSAKSPDKYVSPFPILVGELARRPVRKTLAPLARNRSAIASPIPLEAPVIITFSAPLVELIFLAHIPFVPQPDYFEAILLRQWRSEHADRTRRELL